MEWAINTGGKMDNIISNHGIDVNTINKHISKEVPDFKLRAEKTNVLWEKFYKVYNDT